MHCERVGSPIGIRKASMFTQAIQTPGSPAILYVQLWFPEANNHSSCQPTPGDLK